MVTYAIILYVIGFLALLFGPTKKSATWDVIGLACVTASVVLLLIEIYNCQN